jgi:hypothetical protein
MAQLEHRVRHLPEQLRRAREKVKRLEDEARRYGFKDLLNDSNSDPSDCKEQCRKATDDRLRRSEV